MSELANLQFTILRKPIRELISNNCFNIPDFQRDFTWHEHYDVFLDDILKSFQHPDEKEYYIGTIITYVNPETGRHEIVDGQQRLTSLIFTLMGYTIYLINENKDANFQKTAKKILQKETWGSQSKEDVPIISTSDPDAQNWFTEFFTTNMQIPKNNNSDNTKLHSKALKTAIKWFEDLDKKRGTRVDIHQVLAYFLDNIVVAHVDALNFRQAYIVFERMNDRGKPLSIPDKLKYLLMRKYTVSPSEFEKYSGDISLAWRAIADKFNGDNEFTTFLVHYFTAFYSPSNSKFFAQDEIVDWFRTNWNDSDDVFDLLDDMEIKSNHYVNFQQQLNIMKNPSEEPSLAYMYEFFDRSINQHYPILLAASTLTNAQFAMVCENILKITAVNGICKVKWQTIRTGKNSVMDMVLCLREKDVDGFKNVVKNAIFETAYSNQFVTELTKKDKFADKMGNTKIRKFLTTKVEDIVQNESGKDFRFTRIEAPAVDHPGKKGKAKPKKTTATCTLEHILASVIAKDKNDAKDYDNTIETLKLNKPPEMHEQDILNLAGRLGNFVASGADENIKGNKRPVDEKYKLYKTDLYTTRLMVQDFITIDYRKDPGESDQTRTIRKYHYEPIKLQSKDKDNVPYPDKRKYFLEPQIAKREHIIINVLKEWLGFKENDTYTTSEGEEIKIKEMFAHPDKNLYDCKYCKNPKYNPYKLKKTKK